MAGIYIHIPFCKQRCNYCDFYKEISLSHTGRFTEALRSELIQRSNYLNSASVRTIYFGGGTPSVLLFGQFNSIFETLYEHFSIDSNAEITLEANPDDLTPDYLRMLSNLPFNRISIGIQSFNDNELRAVNRRHTAQQATMAVQEARKAGFRNISIDLIYGLPGQSMEQWKINLEKAFELEPEHISAYGLTFEEGTGLWKQREKGLVKEVPDELMLEMYRYMMLQMNEKGYDAYEISNFAKPGYRSLHNSSYWDMSTYLGAGPSAHSYNGYSRQWNIAHLLRYMEGIELNQAVFEIEHLDEKDAYNDFIMVRLRTSEGIDLKKLSTHYGDNSVIWCLKQAETFIWSGHLKKTYDTLTLTPEGVEISNTIIAHLMKTD